MSFFDYSESVNSVERFGIRDDEEGKQLLINKELEENYQGQKAKQAKEMPAFVDYTEKSLWNAEILSDNRNDFNFIAVDNQIPYFDKDGNQKTLCDAIVWTPNTIIFIELKTNDKSWCSKAIDQLESTIEFFKSCEDINKFKYMLVTVSTRNLIISIAIECKSLLKKTALYFDLKKKLKVLSR